jgi:uncharacterized membrane protein
MEQKNLQLERLVFFSDAIVAIAITLLALDIKIKQTVVAGHLSFEDILAQWKTFAAFFLSFINIAGFWKTHHNFFVFIKKIDEKLLWFNIGWLLFIILLPFSTSLVSSYFFDTPAIFIYSLNIFLISCFQNLIWDYSSVMPEYIKTESIDTNNISQFRLFCNLDMINGIIAIVISFFNPGLAFISLFTKLPILIIAGILHRKNNPRKIRRKKE